MQSLSHQVQFRQRDSGWRLRFVFHDGRLDGALMRYHLHGFLDHHRVTLHYFLLDVAGINLQHW